MGRQTNNRIYATDLPVYDSMAHCSGATGIPKEALSYAKKNGCKAFRANRVHLAEFLQWFFAQNNDDGVNWKGRKDRAQALREEIKLEVDRHIYVEFSLAERFIAKLVREVFFGELDRLKLEFPASLPGKSELSIKTEVDSQISRIRKLMHSTMDAWIAECKTDNKE